ncbi:histone-lysine N-methyltransferase SETMAR [Copidosoma floridanum]|uniref:histone-lysine N-methyltransferase SETMAR n=1 Tax=Copidosoma floridanum TaxID=29053 RepID=UPI0006C98574|nr:histone-lysine N-methyltransferase SETMAR [Copidosoma floridanum]
MGDDGDDATTRPDEYEHHPQSGIIYIVSNIPGPGSQPDDFEMQFSVGCDCDQECKNNHCSCIRGTPNYVDARLSTENSNSIIECNFNCTCHRNCGNRLVQYGPVDSLVVKNAINSAVGLGLFTMKRIKRNQFICEYAGEVIGIDEAQRRLEANKINGSMNYVLVVSEYVGDKKITTCLDPAKFGSIGRYANHSCQPNAALVPVRVDITIPKLCLFALRDIEPEEEITFNYAGDTSVHNLSETPCLCGNSSCLGYLPHSTV